MANRMEEVEVASTEVESALDGWLISSDSHIIEPPTLWSDRLPPDLRERGPRVVREGDADFWYTEGYRTASFHGSEAGARFEKDADQLRGVATFEECRPQSHEPDGYLDDNATDGVWASVIYPTFGLTLFQIPDTDLLTALVRTYNDWLAEFCRGHGDRLKGVAMVNVDDPSVGAAELRRARDLGLSGALVTVTPPEWSPFDSEAFEPFWATAQDLAMPLSLHVGTMRADSRKGAAGFDDIRRFATSPLAMINRDARVRESLARIILSGVFQRFPRLRVGTIEQEIGWIPFFLDQLDFQYTQRARRGITFGIGGAGVLPSDFWRQNCFASFQEDANGLRLRDVIGVDTLLWGSDYPHIESTFPRSRQILASTMKGVPVEEIRRIVSSNAHKLYDIPNPPHAQPVS